MNHSSINRVALSALAACLVLTLQACTASGGSTTCKATTDCASGSICSSGTCKKSCNATTDCQAGQDCRLGASSDSVATCNSVSYAQPSKGGFGTDCSLFACNQGGDNPCADGFSCRAGAKCDPYAVCSATCKTDSNCPPEYFCASAVDASTTGTMCTKASDCAEDEFCAVTRNTANVTIQICEKKMCVPRGRCSECSTDAQCRANGLQASFICAHDNAGGRYCAPPCNSDRDCLKPNKQQVSGGYLEYGQFEKCLPDSATGTNVCTPATGACHGKSSIAAISGDGQVCSPCRPDLSKSDCSEGLGCFTSSSLENFCTTGCTFLVQGDPDGAGDYTNFMTVPDSDTCPSGSHCAFGNVVYPGTCKSGCKVGGKCTLGGTCDASLKCGYCPQPSICTADPDNTGVTCALP